MQDRSRVLGAVWGLYGLFSNEHLKALYHFHGAQWLFVNIQVDSNKYACPVFNRRMSSNYARIMRCGKKANRMNATTGVKQYIDSGEKDSEMCDAIITRVGNVHFFSNVLVFLTRGTKTRLKTREIVKK